MAPSLTPFPVCELGNRIKTHEVGFKTKRRKIPDLDLTKCELFELVQYSCTTPNEKYHRTASGSAVAMECTPFVRLFRRCGEGAKMFHVETTVWEGEHAYKPVQKTPKDQLTAEKSLQEHPSSKTSPGDTFANYANMFPKR